MMLKQSPIIRNLRTRGFKVKHALQICLLLAISIWLLYQVNRSHYQNEYSDPSLADEIRTENPIFKFGRKDLNYPRTRDHDLESRKNEDKKEEELGEEDAEDSKVEEISSMEGRGGGDDEIDGNDREKAEEEEEDDSDSELEDFIDEEDREKEEPNMVEEESTKERLKDNDDESTRNEVEIGNLRKIINEEDEKHRAL